MIKLGITIGDVNGIGLEVIIKTLSEERLLKHCIPIIYGSTRVVSYHKNVANLDDFKVTTLREDPRVKPGRVYVVNCWEDEVKIELGSKSKQAGVLAGKALDCAMADFKQNKIDALVTAPINKEVMKAAGFGFPGHTEYLAHQFDQKNHLMCMVHQDLRIALATNHLSVKEVSSAISKSVITKKIKTFISTLQMDFGIEKPTIAVLGLNPHAGDGGTIGMEEIEVISPAILELKKKGNLVYGPFSSDGFFGSASYKKYDGILAMYHDQGLIPFKLSSFGSGVNFTAGLPFVRTSPDHGTGFDIAGKGLADPGSFRTAIFLALDLARNRRAYQESRANKLQANGTPV